MKRFLFAAALVAACGGDGGGGADGAPSDGSAPTGDGAEVDGGARADAPPGCPVPDTAWIQAYEQEVVAKLAGATEIAPGVTLTNRATAAARDATRSYLLAELTAWGLAPDLHAYESGANVFAVLPATEPGGGGAVLLGAHFDGVMAGPAAADDGTGTALVLAAAGHLAELPCRRRDVVVALFDQEELGLVGSNEFAAKLQADGTPVDFVHVFDMISWDSDGDRAIELWSPSPALATLYEQVGADLGVPVQAVAFTFSDHQSFLDAGFVTTGVSEEFVGGDYNPNYHMASDTYANVDFDYLAGTTRVALEAVRRHL